MQFKSSDIFVITGGTGSFGHAVIQYLLTHSQSEIRVFSRDELKQDDMRKKFNNERLKFYIGDVRDFNSLHSVMQNATFVFHAAALKQVPSCEFYPLEAVKTNILGTENVLQKAMDCYVEKVVCLSTDKAVYPINAMGISKAMMEKVMIAKSRVNHTNTVICGTRYGNVMASRGSVIPLFKNQFENNLPLTITDPNMTRFMMTLSDAVALVMHAFKNANNGDIYVQKSPAATIEVLVDALWSFYENSKSTVKIIGVRHGEKKYETLCSVEEMAKAEHFGNYYRIPCDSRSLDYDLFYSKGSSSSDSVVEYNSENTYRLNKSEMVELLKKI